MKFSCKASDAVQAVRDCERVVWDKAQQPILQCIRIRVTGGSTLFRGTDLTTTVESAVLGDEEKTGEVVVPKKMLKAVLGKFSKGEGLSFTKVGEHDLSIESFVGKPRGFTVKGMDPEDFPEVPEVLGEVLEVPRGILVGAFQRALFAVSNAEAQYYLNGVCLSQKGKMRLLVVGTDGRRLSRVTHSLQVFPTKDEVIVPKETVGVVLHLFDEGELLNVFVSEKKATKEVGSADTRYIRFSQGLRVVTSTLVEGQFPDYEQVFPGSYDGTVTIPAQPLLSAVDDASLMADFSRRVQLKIAKDGVSVSASDPEKGEATVTVEGSWTGKHPVNNLCFNFAYLLDYLKLCNELGYATVDVGVNYRTKREKDPVTGEQGEVKTDPDGYVNSPTNWKQDGWDYLLMPMKEK